VATLDIIKPIVKYAVLISLLALIKSDFAMASLNLFLRPLPNPKSKYPSHNNTELIVSQIPYTSTGSKDSEIGNKTKLIKTEPN
jgi:hypothetical protein